ncbi:MAG TPA: glyoxylate/hydroxypyruvate reductase A [Bauldia sp.]|nr:glyoxylate/hydroxypyruvate reductase A [Bauldia sp.]
MTLMGRDGGNDILIASGPWDPAPWAEAVRAIDPHRATFIWPDLPDSRVIRYVMAWHPPEAALQGLPNLKVIFSLGAGVEHILSRETPPDVPVVRIVSNDLTKRMTEWVTLQVLMHHRRQRQYDRLQAERRWQELRQPAASDVRVGVMGMGVLGRSAAEVLVQLGFRVAGWSRRPKTIAGVESYHGDAALDPFLARTDILVALLPLTPETRGLLSMPLFHKLARDGALGGPVLINAGRGGLQVEADIVRAMRDGVLIGASLDVFETEPLDRTSPLWGLENVIVTPHCAAWSDPVELTRQILDQIAAFESGRPLRNVVDRDASY